MSELLLTVVGVALLLLVAADASWCDPEAAPVPIDLHLALMGGACVLYAVIVVVVMRRTTARSILWTLAGLAVILRVVVLTGPHRYNSDVWRYVWDGHVLASGMNPYAHAPDDPALDGIRDEAIYGRLNPAYNGIRTVYGPVATACFAVIGRAPPDPAWTIRAVMAAGDLLTFVLVAQLLACMNLPRGWSLVYGLNPLLLDSFAGRGQVDGILLPWLVAAALLVARRRYAVAGVALAAAALVKIVALVAAPILLAAVWRRNPRAAGRFAVTFGAGVVAGGWLWISAGPEAFTGLATYARHWRANESLFAVTEALGGAGLARIVALAGVTAVLIACLRRMHDPRDLPVRIGAVFAAVLLLAPAVFPWYVTWLLPFAPFLFASQRLKWAGVALLCWSGTVLLWYLRFLAYPPFDDPYWPRSAVVAAACQHMREPWRIIEYLLPAVLLATGLLFQARDRPDSHAPSERNTVTIARSMETKGHMA